MPIYEYKCKDCNKVFEVYTTDYNKDQAACPMCALVGDKIMSKNTFRLRGRGWYNKPDFPDEPPFLDGSRDVGEFEERQGKVEKENNG